jgi:hypothetical protein
MHAICVIVLPAMPTKGRQIAGKEKSAGKDLCRQGYSRQVKLTRKNLWQQLHCQCYLTSPVSSRSAPRFGRWCSVCICVFSKTWNLLYGATRRARNFLKLW